MNRRRRDRRAVSLAELLVVMTACTIILSMSAALIHRAMRAHSTTRAFLDNERTALRLSGQFRDDVQRATTATATETQRDDRRSSVPFVQLQLPGQKAIDYYFKSGTIVRLMSIDSRPISQEEFSFPRSATLALHEESEPQRLILTITAEETPSDAHTLASTSQGQRKSVALQVEVSVGRRTRYPEAHAILEAQE